MNKIIHFLPSVLACVTGCVVSSYIFYGYGYQDAMQDVRSAEIQAGFDRVINQKDAVMANFYRAQQVSQFDHIAQSADMIDTPISMEAMLDGEALGVRAVMLTAPEVEGLGILCMRDIDGHISSTPVVFSDENPHALIRAEKTIADSALVSSFNACIKSDIMMDI